MSLPEENPCAVCLDNLGTPVAESNGCSHIFHSRCIKRWMFTARTCPICRSSFNFLRVFDVIGGAVVRRFGMREIIHQLNSIECRDLNFSTNALYQHLINLAVELVKENAEIYQITASQMSHILHTDPQYYLNPQYQNLQNLLEDILTQVIQDLIDQEINDT